MSDEELVRRMKNNDEMAVEIIIRKYYDEIYRFLCRKLSNNIEAEDVTQIVFIKLVNSIHTYNEKGKLRNYLFKLAVNASNDYYRKSVKYKLYDELEEIDSNEIPLDELMEKKEIAIKVKGVLDELPIYQRDVIIMRFYHDLKFQDIAKIMKSNLSSTKSRYQQGIKKLKNILKEVI